MFSVMIGGISFIYRFCVCDFVLVFIGFLRFRVYNVVLYEVNLGY